jgi:hypothetical protein
LAITLTALAKAARTGPFVAPQAPAPSSRSWSQGTYIWNSRALLDSALRPSELLRLKRAGMTHLLVGLTGEQVAAGADTERALQQLVAAGHGERMRVSLLLGDPEWILPQGRQSLLDLIQRYRGIGFDGLHLDLEVEQLGWPPSRPFRRSVPGRSASPATPVGLKPTGVPVEIQANPVFPVNLATFKRST